MRSIDAFTRLALLALPVFASGGLLPVKRGDGEVLKDSYIVMLKDGCNVDDITDSIPNMNITNQWSIVNGFAATLSPDRLEQLRALPNISSISENTAARTAVKQ